MEKEKYEAPRMEVVNMQDDVVIACTAGGSGCVIDCSRYGDDD